MTPSKPMHRPVVRSAEDSQVHRYRMSRCRSTKNKQRSGYWDDDHSQRMSAHIMNDFSFLKKHVVLTHRFAKGRGAHRTPNPFLWGRMRTLGGSHKYHLKVRRVGVTKGGPWVGKAGYPLRPFGRGAKGGNRSVAL